MLQFIDYLVFSIVLLVTILCGFIPKIRQTARKRLRNTTKKAQFIANGTTIANPNENDEEFSVLASETKSKRIKESTSASFYLSVQTDQQSSSNDFSTTLNSSPSNKLANKNPSNKHKSSNLFMNSISLMIGFQTTVSMVGLPVEYYYYGFKSLQITLCMILAPFVIAYVFIPFIYKIKSKSIYEYLNDKFEGERKTVKHFTLLIGIIFQFVFGSLVLYSTGICIMQIVSLTYPISLWPIVLFIGVLSACLALLGLQSVVWINFVQYLVMVLCNILIIYLGIRGYSKKTSNNSNKSFGNSFSDMWEVTESTGRSQLFVFEDNLRYRYSIWNCMFGLMFNILPSYSLTQQSFMRIKQSKSVKSARILILSMIPFGMFNMLLLILIGFVMFAYFYKCGDPFTLGSIANQNQLLVKFLTQFYFDYSGFIGLYIALLVNSGIGTISSVLKALSITLIEEVLKKTAFLKRDFSSANEMSKQNSFLNKRLLFEKENEIIYEEDVLELKIVSHSRPSKKRKLMKKFLRKYQNQTTRRQTFFIIFLCAIVFIGLSICLDYIKGSLISICFSLLNTFHGPVLFIYCCARFNHFAIKRFKLAEYRSKESKLKNLRISQFDIILSSIISILFVASLFTGRLLTYSDAKEFYDFDRLNVSQHTLQSLQSSTENIQFCRLDQNEFVHLNTSNVIFANETSSSMPFYSYGINQTDSNKSNDSISHINFFNYLFGVSFNWYPMIGFFTCLISLSLINSMRLIKLAFTKTILNRKFNSFS